MSLDIDTLRVFVRVAETGSFTRAAEQLAMPKARASAYVQKLEAELGTRLLQRSTRIVQLTPEGERLIARARTFLTEAEEIGTMFHAGGALRGRVRIELPVLISTEYVVPRVPELLARHPHLELEILSTERGPALRRGFDIVLRAGHAEEPGLVGRRLAEVAMKNCASPGYLREHGTPKTVEDLDHHLLVAFAPDGPPGFEYFDGREYRNHPMRVSITVDDIDAYHAAAAAGLGIVQVPRQARGRHVEQLVDIMPEHVARPLTMSLLHTHGRAVPRRVRVVMTWIADLLAPLATEVMRSDGPEARTRRHGQRPSPAA